MNESAIVFFLLGMFFLAAATSAAAYERKIRTQEPMLIAVIFMFSEGAFASAAFFKAGSEKAQMSTHLWIAAILAVALIVTFLIALLMGWKNMRAQRKARQLRRARRLQINKPGA